MSTAAEIKKRGYCDMCPSFGWGCSTCPALARAHRETAATPTGSAGLSDDRLADDMSGLVAGEDWDGATPLINAPGMIAEIRRLRTELARTREDAALGALLRAVVATVDRGGELGISRYSDGLLAVWRRNAASRVNYTDPLLVALSAALSRDRATEGGDT